MNLLIIAALVGVAAAAPQQQFAYRQQQQQQPAVVATITRSVTRPVTYQVPVATITRNAASVTRSNDATVIEAAQPQFVQQSQFVSQPQYSTSSQAVRPVVQIIKLERSQEPSGDYSYSFQADNGIQASERAVIKSVRDEKNEEHFVPNVEGSYSYTGPDNVQYTVNYVADEFGYRATGAHLPVPPVA